MVGLATPTDLTAYESGDPQTILDQAGEAIRSYCGWIIAPAETVTVKIDGGGSQHLWLPTLKLTDVTAVTNQDDVVDLSTLDWSESGYLQLRSGHWSTRPRGVEVTMTHGYVETPADVMGVIVGIASRAVASPSGIVGSTASGPFAVSYIAADGVAGGLLLMQHERAILDHYKLPPRA